MLKGFCICYYIICITAVLREEQTFVTNPKEIQQINFTEGLDRAGVTVMFFICESVRKLFRILRKELQRYCI